MNSESVFINCDQGDLELARKIKESLETSGIHVFLPEGDRTPSSIAAIIKKIETILQNNGIMLVLLNDEAARDNLVISNTQLCSELAGKRQSLVICKNKKTSNDQVIALYYPRAVQINVEKDPLGSIPRVVSTVKRTLGLEKSSSLIPKRISKKAITWLVWIAVALSLTGGLTTFFVGKYQEKQEAIQAAQAPVVINVPFAEESIDQGYDIAQRSIPLYQSTDDPEKLAPFRFQPKILTDQITFDDPKFDNTLDYSIINKNDNSISEEDQKLVIQQNGILQISGRPKNNKHVVVNSTIKHIFTTQNTSYIGIRFRLEDYQGWSDIQHESGIMLRSNNLELVFISATRQKMVAPNHLANEKTIGTSWHSLEAILSPETNTMDVYLDGDLFYTAHNIAFTDQQENLFVNMDVMSATDWVSLYIDEIIFGSNQGPKIASDAEQALFRFAPEEITYFNPFNDATQMDISAPENATIYNGVLNLKIGANNNNKDLSILFPTGPITTANYFALKYRIRESAPVSWTNDGHLEINVGANESIQKQVGYRPSMTTELPSAGYFYSFGINDIQGLFGSEDNFQKGTWHTMEIVFLPTSSDGSSYEQQYWHDGQLVGQGAVVGSEIFLNPSTNLVVVLQLFAGNDIDGGLSLDVDDITFGYIPNEVTSD